MSLRHPSRIEAQPLNVYSTRGIRPDGNGWGPRAPQERASVAASCPTHVLNRSLHREERLLSMACSSAGYGVDCGAARPRSLLSIYHETNTTHGWARNTGCRNNATAYTTTCTQRGQRSPVCLFVVARTSPRRYTHFNADVLALHRRANSKPRSRRLRVHLSCAHYGPWSMRAWWQAPPVLRWRGALIDARVYAAVSYNRQVKNV